MKKYIATLGGFATSILLIMLYLFIVGMVNNEPLPSIYYLFEVPGLLIIYPFKMISHYPDTLLYIAIHGIIFYLLEKRYSIIGNFFYCLLASIVWELLGLFVLMRQIVDF
ncbi:hypothetical protein DPQ33_18310 [Oceanidesulfovibrio indonesiensis]|uniref:Uncharacterized protein n=1 Tax=Oceanidesulfovibrio indonesiensis TaxID=54767 RepID=A0A7M3M9T0_9BACT|nr:hypothetical protein [Oceanidesulfovibrio indonesiensis]TVM13308.1 hypothetical protein DPQ33_18310 [Oceanidesulfovibrio indonesiensis]